MSQHLVFLELEGNTVKKSSLSAITAAKAINGKVHGLILGKDLQKAQNEAARFVDTLYCVSDNELEHLLAMPCAKAIADIAQKTNATHVWAAASVLGKSVMPRVAVKLDAAMASDIQEVKSANTFVRPVYAGDFSCQLELLTDLKVITVRASEFEPAKANSSSSDVMNESVTFEKCPMRFVAFDEVKSERPKLTEAQVVVSGGRGLKGPEGFTKIIEPLADHFNAAIGASRAVCDAGWVPNDWQVGQTGKVVAPKLYFAIGISGAIQHVAGIKGSKVIVAINKDPDAPIFQVADYGLVEDAFVAVPQLLEQLKL